MTASILFVCLGNICRSPTAEGVFRTKVAELGESGRDWLIDSAGTAAWHTGNPPDTRSQAAAKARGYDLSALKARQVTLTDFSDFQFILAMDVENLENLKPMAQQCNYTGHLGLFLDFAQCATKEVPDPYYGGEQGFETVLDLIEDASTGLIHHVRQIAHS